MEARPGTWGQVRTDMHIQDKNGKPWKVVAGNDTHVGLVDRDGEELILPRPVATAPVGIYYLTQAELEDQIREQLGGTVQAIKRHDDSIFICRRFDAMMTQEMISHITLMHRVYVGSNGKGLAGTKTAKQLTECHDELHENPDHKWVPHIHEDRLNRPSPFDQEV